MPKLALIALVIGAVFVSNAFAALTASNISMSDVLSDITLVFLAILGVFIVIFIYKKIISLLRIEDDNSWLSEGGGSYFKNGKEYHY